MAGIVGSTVTADERGALCEQRLFISENPDVAENLFFVPSSFEIL